MLKTSYETQEAIPENMRGAYVQSGGKWSLDELSSDHPVIVKRGELLGESATQRASIQRLTAEKQALEGSTLPTGHVAVPLDKAKMIERLEPLGSASEIETKVKAHDVLKAKVESQEKIAVLRAVAADNGYDPEKIAALEDRFPAPSFRDVKVDGKAQKEAYFKAKEGDKDVERSFTEYMEASPNLKPLLDSLKATNGGTRVHGSSSNGGTPPKDVFTKIRDNAKKESEAAQSDIHPMFRQIPGRVAQA